MGEPNEDHSVATRPRTLGVLTYTGDGSRPDLVIEAVRQLAAVDPLHVLLIGAPGPTASDAAEWIRLARQAGIENLVSFSGILSSDELSAALRACDIAVLPNDLGPSGRRTSLASALAYAMPTVALDGPDRWDSLVDENAVAVVEADASALATAIDGLLRSPQRRLELSRNGRAFYDGHMNLESTGGRIASLLFELEKGIAG
jgi:glycosyltransferase involved in cell wall biosynthesis